MEAEQPDILGFSLTASQWPRAREIARDIKGLLGLPSIAGGLQTTFASDTVLANPGFDYACIGEGEGPLLELLERLEEGDLQGARNIPNIRVRGGPFPALRPPLADLDTLPFVARDLLAEQYGVLHLTTQRGCPFPCTFCAAGSINALYPKYSYQRRRSVPNVLEEIRQLRSLGPLNYLVFLDDTFTLNHHWVQGFCRAYGEEFGIGFSVNARAETVTPNLLSLLAGAGCRHVTYGIESGSPRIRRDVLKRQVDNERLVEVFEWSREAGLLATANYMLGIPGETAADIEQTLDLHHRLAPDDFGYFVFHPYPGTPLYELCRRKGYLPAGHEDRSLEDGESVLTLPDLSRQELADYYQRFAELRSELYRQRYSGP